MANAIPGVKALRMAVIMVACAAPYDPLLPHRALLERYDWWDNRDWDWYAEKITAVGDDARYPRAYGCAGPVRGALPVVPHADRAE